jgi:3-methyladenine DNA glycosylase AlkC
MSNINFEALSDTSELRETISNLQRELDKEKYFRTKLEMKLEDWSMHQGSNVKQMVDVYTKQAEIDAITEEFTRKLQQGFDEAIQKSFNKIAKIEHDLCKYIDLFLTFIQFKQMKELDQLKEK